MGRIDSGLFNTHGKFVLKDRYRILIAFEPGVVFAGMGWLFGLPANEGPCAAQRFAQRWPTVGEEVPVRRW